MHIDLGEKFDSPEAVAVVTSPPREQKVHYPSIYLRGGSELKDIPESGTITFSFDRVSQSVRERDGKKHCEVELECHAVLNVKSDGEKPSKSRESILDDLKEEVEDGEGY